MIKQGYFHRVSQTTPTRMWINNVTPEEAKLAIEAGAVGCTQNPSYVWKMMQSDIKRTYGYLDEILKTEKDDNEALIKLQKKLIEDIADVFMPVWEKSGGQMGHVTIQGDPFNEAAENIVRQAHFNCADKPNMSAKLPVTKDGLTAIASLASKGYVLTMTEVMGLAQAVDACQTWEDATSRLKNKPPVYMAHIPGIYDEYLQNTVKENALDINGDYLWQAGVSVSKKVYEWMRTSKTAVRFMGGGARGLHHFTELVGVDGYLTINWQGTADLLLEQDPPVLERFREPTSTIITDYLSAHLEDYDRGYRINGLKAEEYESFGPVVLFRNSFEQAWQKALKAIAERRQQI